MQLILTLLFVAFIMFVGLGVYVGVKTVRAAKRGVDRTISQARRSVEDTTLRAKSYGQPGVPGELAQLRLALRTSMRATQDALEAGVAEDASLRESLGLFERLSVHGRELDDDLKRLEREPDRASVATLLPGLKERTERITHSADSLRWAARDRARQFADDDLEALNAQIDMEAGALRHWTTDEPSAPDGGARRPEPGARGGPAPEATARGRGPADAGVPQALAPKDPRPADKYPWQKSTRPETTN
ncbi:hypothetical protein OG909_08890 [Streptomyces sp. NBC_01754]|uniref:hypothetical protein n=1 Tax=Streptomyces sp. NBC_01754 TaxID=2975930 RepID=UPI002DD8CE10|nr:hypothetical protein [Streptomyces sp. NBC_01754]WSC96786.1 hypothetical protein OG909_08890 [Streptomyces sp. NBC_01754]